MVINDVAGKGYIMYDLFFMNFWVINFVSGLHSSYIKI